MNGNIWNQLAGELAAEVLTQVKTCVRSELHGHAKSQMTFCYTEEEAAAELKCSPQTLARRRKAGEIDFTENPAGKPVYMTHHLLDYLIRHESKNGKQQVTLADVLQFPAEAEKLLRKVA